MSRGRPEAWEPTFFEVLGNKANVSEAIRMAAEKVKPLGISLTRAYVYRRRRSNTAFRERWDEAIQTACDRLEDVAWTRAETTSDQLLMFLLKAHRREVYTEPLAELVARAEAKLFTQGMSGDRAALETFLRAKKPEVWDPPTRLRIGGDDGGPVQFSAEGLIARAIAYGWTPGVPENGAGGVEETDDSEP